MTDMEKVETDNIAVVKARDLKKYGDDRPGGDEDELASARKIRNGCGGRECKEGACQFFFWDRVGWPSCRLMVDENGDHIPPCLWKLGDEKEESSDA